MLMSMNSLERFTLLKSNKQPNTVFKKKDTTLSENSKQTAKKRSFNEIGTNHDYPSKAKRTLKNRESTNVKVMNNPTIYKLKQLEKNRLLEISTGMHPALKKANDEISKLSTKLKKVEEQSTFWRQRALHLQKQLRSSKNSSTNLHEKVVKLEAERVLLLKKVNVAEEESNKLSGEANNWITENNELKETIKHLDEELKALMDDDTNLEAQVADSSTESAILEKALEDSLADLSDRLVEIEDLKKLLTKVTIEKNLFEEQMAKNHIIAEFADLNEDEAEGASSNKKIRKLESAVEKCMFRIAVLTQKNEELRKVNSNVSFSSDQDTRMMEVLEDDEKLCLLESVCMKQYRKLLKKAAGKLGRQEIVNVSL